MSLPASKELAVLEFIFGTRQRVESSLLCITSFGASRWWLNREGGRDTPFEVAKIWQRNGDEKRHDAGPQQAGSWTHFLYLCANLKFKLSVSSESEQNSRSFVQNFAIVRLRWNELTNRTGPNRTGGMYRRSLPCDWTLEGKFKLCSSYQISAMDGSRSKCRGCLSKLALKSFIWLTRYEENGFRLLICDKIW